MAIQDSSDTITQSAKCFFSGTMISRVTGLTREVAMAAAFGTEPMIAAFWMAFRFAYLLRRLFGEGALNISFIPYFESLRKEDLQKGARFFYDLCAGITLILLFLIILTEAVLGGCLLFKEMHTGTREVIRLTIIMLPSILFISLYALSTALLNCEGTYFFPSVAPAFFNLIWVIAIAFLWRKPPHQALEYLAMIIVFAFALQWFVTVPHVLHCLSDGSAKSWWKEKSFSRGEILLIIRPFLLGMLGVTATQINSALDAIFARIADCEGPAFLWYAIRIQQLPLALFGLGLTGALLPPISRACENNDEKQYRSFINFALKRILMLMIPISGAIFALGFCGVNLVYGRGAFTSRSILQTTPCLWAYGAGLFPMTTVLIFAAAFYARKNYRLPTLLAIATVGLNIGLNALFIFVFQMKALSVAIATTLTACINSALLAVFLHKERVLDWNGLGIYLLKIFTATLFATLVTIIFGYILFQDQTWPYLFNQPLTVFKRNLSEQFFIFGCETLLFGISLLLFVLVFRIYPVSKNLFREISSDSQKNPK